MLILAIETSCDETAVAIVENGVTEICNVVASSADLHKSTGGIVPEVAARKQVEFIVPVVEKCLDTFISTKDLSARQEAVDAIDAIAVTYGPGLIGSLLVGVEAAKALALAWSKPLIPVNHLVGHIYANWVNADSLPELPALALVVSGGHTDLVLVNGQGDLKYLGGTLDDAAGEAFDKTARLIGLDKYLGGPLLSKKAAECTNNTIQGRLPRPMLDKDNYDFSFSGLKTAVRRIVEQENPPQDAVACEFETAVVDVLVSKTIRAAKEYNVSSILVGGGVSANGLLRTRLTNSAKGLGVSLHLPSLNLCTDTASYIASAAYFVGKETPLEEVKADPSLSIMD
jgi:N6-L-threonylcarbamoyladenine synthase